ncbi:MAG TPA: class IV adenylate cyclase [Bacteroidota bacterium]|nr:class IV adenylate cyclase [Bacteroidota bacterium]
MATNLELKARISSLDEALACARSCGATFQGILTQRDTYFRVGRGRLKLREFAEGGAELIFYERREDSPERWSHYTKEPVGDGSSVGRVLSEAFGILAVVQKRRMLFLFRGARIHIDDVDGLGSFVEFEVPGEESPEVLATMRELRSAFGITDPMVLRNSYSDIVFAKKNFP